MSTWRDYLLERFDEFYYCVRLQCIRMAPTVLAIINTVVITNTIRAEQGTFNTVLSSRPLMQQAADIATEANIMVIKRW